MEKIYIAKENSYFKVGSEAKLIRHEHSIYGEKFGVFEGTYIIKDDPYDKSWKNKGYDVGDEVLITEMCSYEEFEEHYKLPDEPTMNKMAFDFANTQIKQILSAYPNADIDVDSIKLAYKAGFKSGFKYLDKLLNK